MRITFAHLADCHIGSWKDVRMRDLASEAFDSAVELCLSKNVDFVLVAGDLFHTSLPAIDSIKRAVEALRRLRDRHIPVYLIPGSHDFSPSGKTMLDVLEKAGLCVNVARGSAEEEKLVLSFTTDHKTGVKLAGVLGRRGMLEKGYFQDLDRPSLEQEPGFKIFMLHTAIEELKPKELRGVEAPALSLLPKGFSYYAAGHVHYVLEQRLQAGGVLVYPGPLFPDNFHEIEELGHGGFFLVRADTDTGDVSLERVPVVVRNAASLALDCEGLSPEAVSQRLIERIRSQEFASTIVALRLSGRLSSGKASDVDFKAVFAELYARGAHFVMRNTAALESPEFEAIAVKQSTVEEIEEAAIAEHAGQFAVPGWSPERHRQAAEALMRALSSEQPEGERKQDYEKRLLSEIRGLFGLDEG